MKNTKCFIFFSLLVLMSCSEKENCDFTYKATAQSGIINEYIYIPEDTSVSCYEKALENIEALDNPPKSTLTEEELESRREFNKKAAACGLIIEPEAVFDHQLVELPAGLTNGIETLTPEEALELTKTVCVQSLYYSRPRNIKSLERYEFQEGKLFVEFTLNDELNGEPQKRVIEYTRNTTDGCTSLQINCRYDLSDWSQ